MPGGTVEPGERPEAACVREYEEETGLTVAIVRELVRQTTTDTQGRPIEFVTVTFLVEPLQAPATVVLHPAEHDAFEWVEVAEMRHRDDVVWHVAAAIEAWESRRSQANE